MASCSTQKAGSDRAQSVETSGAWHRSIGSREALAGAEPLCAGTDAGCEAIAGVVTGVSPHEHAQGRGGALTSAGGCGLWLAVGCSEDEWLGGKCLNGASCRELPLMWAHGAPWLSGPAVSAC